MHFNQAETSSQGVEMYGTPISPSSSSMEEERASSFFVRALYDFTSNDSSSMSFERGALIEVLNESDNGWWDGLLSNDVRGWFPSNYVEVISPEELEMELLSREVEEELYIGGEDDRTKLNGGRKSTGLGLDQDVDALRRLMSEASPRNTNDAFEQLAEAVMLDADGRITSKSSCTSHGGSQKATLNSAARRHNVITTAASNLAQPSTTYTIPRASPSDRERSRAQTIAVGAEEASRGQSSLLIRPRASTNVEPGPSGPGFGKKKKQENDFWVPRVTDRGDIYYLNTRTGEQAQDMPDGTEIGAEGGESGTPTSEDGGEEKVTEATARSAPQNPIEEMPDPRTVSYPWVPRASDDERSYYFYNRQTHEVSYDAPRGMMLKSASNGPRITRAATMSSNGRSIRSHGDDDGDEDGAEGLKSVHGDHAKGTQYGVGFYIDEAIHAIGLIASIASERVVSAGLSEEDRLHLEHTSELGSATQDKSRLGTTLRTVVEQVRQVLYATGSLSVSASDLSAIDELAWLVEEEASLDLIKAFQGALTQTHSKSPSSDSEPHVAIAIQHALPSPPVSLTGLGKKINAALSLLVLSTRSVIEQCSLNVPSRPILTTAQLEKIASYRQRIRDDSVDLASALRSFAAELDRHSSSRSGVSWVLSVYAKIDRGSANSDDELKMLAARSVAGWRGNGFVLPSATEVAALKGEASGVYDNPFLLTKEIRNALASGKIALRRKPTTVLARKAVEEDIADVVERTSGSILALQSKLQQRSTNPTNGSNGISSSSGQNPYDNLMEDVSESLELIGELLCLIEDLDLASVLDIDGETAITQRARSLLEAFALNKQDLYDSSSDLFLDSQDAASQMPGPTDENVLNALLAQISMMESAVRRLQASLLDLLNVAEEQGRTSSNNIGARAKVYGVDRVKLPLNSVVTAVPSRLTLQNIGRSHSAEGNTSVSTPVDDGDGHLMEVMYLGPDAILPSGPHNASDRLKLADGLRARSTSIGTTGASITSHDSSTRATSTRKDEEDGDSMRSAVKTNKIKRFFGDDAPTLNSSQASDFDAISPSSISKQQDEIPWYLEPDYSPEDIVMNAQGQVKGATLAALVERLTMHNAFDASFNTTFLMTYRSFSSTEELLELLSARFRIKEPAGLTQEEHQRWVDRKQTLIRFRIFNVLKTWLESHFYEGKDEIYLKRLETFILDGMGHSPILATPGKQLMRLLERRSGKGEKIVRKLQLPSHTPPPILPRNTRKLKFLDIDPLEMARQLTLIDSRLYNRIKPIECLGKAWSRDNGAEIAKGIRDVIAANNKVSGWVSEAVLVQEDLKKRAAWLKHFVAIANQCHVLNNYSSMMAIYSGLNNASLNRLRRTWDAVNQRHLLMFENMKTLLAPTKNFSKYRETLRMLNPPCVPFLGVYLTDLTFIEDGNSDRLKTDERLINFSKRQMTADKIQEIMIYQSTPYNLTPVPSIQEFIEESTVESRRDEDLFEHSLRLEPRERDDEKIARLLQESGFL